MALMTDTIETIMKNLEEEITCSVCKKLYTDPKILSCLHYYCKECILTLALRAGKGQPFSCPECCKDITLPEGGEEELKSAFFIHNLKAVYAKYKKALSKQAHCEMCTDSHAKAEAYCQQCDKFACENCVHMHSVMKAFFDGHKIVSVDELYKECAALTQRNPPPHLHSKPLNLLCYDCSKLICHDCIYRDHEMHRIEISYIAVDDKKKEIRECLKHFSEVEDSVSRALEEVHNTEHEVEVQGDSVANTIVTSFKELHKILDSRKQQLMEEARRIVKEKMKNLKGQEEKFVNTRDELHDIIKDIEQVRHRSDVEVMSMTAELTENIRKGEELVKVENSLEPVEQADMEFVINCGETLQQFCEEKARITHPAENIVGNVLSSSAEVCKESKSMVSLTYEKPVSCKVRVECHLKSLYNGSVVKGSVKQDIPSDVIETIEQGNAEKYEEYHVSFTSSVRGLHELFVNVNGQPV